MTTRGLIGRHCESFTTSNAKQQIRDYVARAFWHMSGERFS
jgi:hypothetical protein